MQKFETFAQFWPHYLRQHKNPRTRALHFIGTTIGGLMAICWLTTGHESYLVLALVFGYGFSWFSHFVVEDNRPATFSNPLWSLRADLRMYAAWLTGSLDDEFRRAGIHDRRAYSQGGTLPERVLARSGRQEDGARP
jgi:hypothetical protein